MAAPSSAPHRQAREAGPGGSRVYGRHQLTGAGAVVLAGATTLAGAGLDLLASGTLGAFLGIGFIAGCLLGAGRVRRSDLRVAVVMGPLVFLSALVLADLVSPAAAGSSWLTSQASTVASGLIVHAPTLLLGSAGAAVVAGLRQRRHRRRRPPRR